MSEADRDLVARVVYTEYETVPLKQRLHVRWVMTADMLYWIRDLFALPPTPLWDPYGPYSDVHSLLGHPVEIREDVQGIRIEMDQCR